MSTTHCEKCPSRVDCLVKDGVTDCEVVELLIREDMIIHLRDPEIVLTDTGPIIAVNLKTFQVITSKFPSIRVNKNPLIRHKHNPEGLEGYWGESTNFTLMFVIMEKEVL